MSKRKKRRTPKASPRTARETAALARLSRTDSHQLTMRAVKVWTRVLKANRASPATARPLGIGVGIGTLAALKFLVRMETGGGLVLTAPPHVIDTIEDLSETIALDFFDELAGELFPTETFDQRITPKRFERTAESLTFRWEKTMDPGALVPPEFHDMERIQSAGDACYAQLLAILEEQLTQAELEDVPLVKMTFFIAWSAASKVVMSVWGRTNNVAAAMETFADILTESEYRGRLPAAAPSSHL